MISNEAGLRPSGARVLVLPIETEQRSEGGILLTDAYKERADMAQIKARVIEVGPCAWHDQPSREWAKPGDVVLIARYAGLFHKNGDKTYRVINDLDIVGVLTNE